MSTDGIRLVVARYREDVSWLDAVGLPSVVYDKSGDPLPGALPLPNVGREAHTYLTHIVDSYPRFADLTVFVQGDPFAHMEQGTGPEELARVVHEIAGRGTPFKGLAWFRMRCDGLGRPHEMHAPENKGRWAGWGRDIPVAATYEALFGGPAPAEFIASASTGVFAVRRERILARQRAFYARALDLVLADPRDENNTGHAFERLWQIIFNGNAALDRISGPDGAD